MIVHDCTHTTSPIANMYTIWPRCRPELKQVVAHVCVDHQVRTMIVGQIVCVQRIAGVL